VAVEMAAVVAALAVAAVVAVVAVATVPRTGRARSAAVVGAAAKAERPARVLGLRPGLPSRRKASELTSAGARRAMASDRAIAATGGAES